MNQWMKDRVQIYDCQRQAYVKYNSITGAVMQAKKTPGPFQRIPIVSLQSQEGVQG